MPIPSCKKKIINPNTCDSEHPDLYQTLSSPIIQYCAETADLDCVVKTLVAADAMPTGAELPCRRLYAEDLGAQRTHPKLGRLDTR